jgi:hypothetical protein
MTRRYASHEIRELLRKNPDGMTLEEIGAVFPDRAINNVRRTLKGLPDSYIDRWESAPRKAYKAVWCVVVPPVSYTHLRAHETLS